MALTKVNRGGLNTGIADSSNATFLTATSAEGVTLAGTLAVTGVHTVGTNAIVTTGSHTTNISFSLIKAYLHFSGSDNSIGDSLNIGTVTDNGTGNYVYNYSNNFDSDEYCFSGMCADLQYGAVVYQEADGSSSSGLEVRHRHNNGGTPAQGDPADTGAMMTGDLA